MKQFLKILSTLLERGEAYKPLRQQARRAHSRIRSGSRSNETGIGRKVSSFAAGLAAGAAMGLLFAPTRGEEVRARIKNAASDLRHRVRPEPESSERLAEGPSHGDLVDDVGAMSRKAIESLQQRGPE